MKHFQSVAFLHPNPGWCQATVDQALADPDLQAWRRVVLLGHYRHSIDRLSPKNPPLGFWEFSEAAFGANGQAFFRLFCRPF